ncbi:Carboxypeptidase N subunit 2 [Halotydeus destructor]|nr:Carboxypeptidase N subunit 2 [Halotydeus destructor]
MILVWQVILIVVLAVSQVPPAYSGCPEDALIAPCRCTSGSDYACRSSIYFDVSNVFVTAEVFHSQRQLNDIRITGVAGQVLPIEELVHDVFCGLSFKQVQIVRTQLRLIHIDAFASTYNFTTQLTLSRNLLTNEVPSEDYNIFRVVNKFTNLVHLDLGYNKIQFLPDHAFGPLKKLQVIVLKSNHITQLGQGPFLQLHSLRYVNLNENKIRYLPETSLQFYKHRDIMELSLATNVLCSTSILHLGHVSRPLKLTLAFNNYTYLKRSVFEPILRKFPQSRIDLKGNPMLCDCRSTWLLAKGQPFLETRVVSVKCPNGKYLTAKDSLGSCP